MNEEMQNQLSKILGMMVEGLEKAGSLAQAELPALVEEYLSMYMIESIPIGATIVTISCIIYYIVGAIIAKHYHKSSDGESWFPFMFIGIIVFVALTISLSHVVENVKEIYKIKTAPKAYLIERLRK